MDVSFHQKKNMYKVIKKKKSNLQACDTKLRTFALKTPLDKMAGIALKGQCDLVSIMVPPRVSIKGSFHRRIENF